MPFYEYQCTACGTQVEVLQKITDEPLRTCGACGKDKLTKLVSAPVFRLKGGGWYETDFKSDQDRKRNLVESDRESGSKEDKADGKTEAAPAKPDAATKPETPAPKPAAAESKPSPAATKPAAGKAAAGPKKAATAKATAGAKK